MESRLGDLEIRHKPETSRFEARVGRLKAFITYRREGRRLALDHTWVPPELEGRGLADRLTRTAFDYARSEGLEVVPECSYVKAWVEKHPEVHELVATGS